MQRTCDIVQLRCDIHRRREPIVDHCRRDAAVRKGRTQTLVIALVAAHPRAAVDVYGERRHSCAARQIQVERLQVGVSAVRMRRCLHVIRPRTRRRAAAYAKHQRNRQQREIQRRHPATFDMKR